MKVFNEIVQGTPEWFAIRAGCVTGSHMADVLATVKSGEAAARRNYRVRLALERITGKPVEEMFTTQAMRDGTEREPIARNLLEFRLGLDIEQVGFVRHDEIACGVSPDGLIGKDGMAEFKCPIPATHLSYLRASGMPPEYVAQVQGQMWIAEREWCLFTSFNPDFPEHARLLVRKVYRDDAYIKSLEAEVRKFLGEVEAEVEAINSFKEAA